jgi:hypothetical protein
MKGEKQMKRYLLAIAIVIGIMFFPSSVFAGICGG